MKDAVGGTVLIQLTMVLPLAVEVLRKSLYCRCEVEGAEDERQVDHVAARPGEIGDHIEAVEGK